MSALEPGLYRATVRGVPDTILMVDDIGQGYSSKVHGIHVGSYVTDARPLIVLDPEALDWPVDNRDKTLNLAKMIRLICDSDGQNYRSKMVRQIADLIDPPKPARIPEPGLWGVVLAGNETREYWVHSSDTGTLQWACVDEDKVGCWSSLIDPTLIREGLS